MSSSFWRSWLWQYGVQLVLVISAIAWAGLIWGDPDLFLFVIITVPVFVASALCRPAHAWVVPAIMAIAFWIIYLIQGDPDAPIIGVLFLGVVIAAWLALVTIVGREIGATLLEAFRQR